MTLHLTATRDKAQIIDLIKTVCALCLFPRIGHFQKNNLRNCVDRIESLAQDANINVDCRFAQDVAGETEIIMKITFGDINASSH